MTTNDANQYKTAIRKKLRFQTKNGPRNTEELWSLKLPDLNELYKALRAEQKSHAQDDLLVALLDTPEGDSDLDLSVAVVRDVIETMIAEQKSRTAENERRAYKAKLLDALEAKEQDELGSKTVDELRALINAM
jgi:hypothetical protein